MGMTEESVRQISSRSIRKITHFMNDTCPLYNPQGTCKCRICKQVTSLNLEKEYTAIKKIIRLVDVYQRLEKELPRKNYWEKIILWAVTEWKACSLTTMYNLNKLIMSKIDF